MTTKSELHAFVRGRLFGPGPWLADDDEAICGKFIEWGLFVKNRGPAPDPKIIDLASARNTGLWLLDVPGEYDDRCYVQTPLGDALDVELMMALAGWGDVSDLPILMYERGLNSEEEMLKAHADWQDGGDLETLLLPLARRAYTVYEEQLQ